MEDVNNILLSGEIPNLYTVDERQVRIINQTQNSHATSTFFPQDIIEQMRNLEKQLDKHLHTDGSGPALFSLFVKRVKENMHVVIAMNPFGESFKSNIAR